MGVLKNPSTLKLLLLKEMVFFIPKTQIYLIQVQYFLYIKMDRSGKKELTKMGNKMDYGLLGMRMDRRAMKELTKMVNWMGFGLGGMIMDRRQEKECKGMVK